MAFEKKWSEEQNNDILTEFKATPRTDKEKFKVLLENLAKKYNTTPEIIDQRIYYLTRREKKRAEKKNKQQIPTQQPGSSDISVSQVTIKEEAPTMAAMYADKEGLEAAGEKQEAPAAASNQATAQAAAVDLTGVPDFVVNFIDDRFRAFNAKHGKIIVQPFTEKEKEMLGKGMYEVIEKRVQWLSEYSDLITLGLVATMTLLPRMIQAFTYNKDHGIEMPIQTAIKAPTPKQEAPAAASNQATAPEISEQEKEKARAMAAYAAEMQKLGKTA